MSYEKSKLLSLLKKQDIDSLFLEATNFLCQTKSLFEEKEQLQQENEQLKDNWNKLKEYLRDFDIEYLNEIMEHNLANTLENILSKMQELEQGSDNVITKRNGHGQTECVGCEITNKRYILEEFFRKYKSIIGDDKC